MFVLNKWNLCEYITFIPESYRFEAGLALYLAILESVVESIEYFIMKANSTIKCIFYIDELREDSHIKPIIKMSKCTMGTAKILCHVTLDGNYKKLFGTEIYLDIPQWFSVQLNAGNNLDQDNNKIKWNISSLLPQHDNKIAVHAETRMEISFIQNNVNEALIDLEPTVKRKFGLKFDTNGFTIQNLE